MLIFFTTRHFSSPQIGHMLTYDPARAPAVRGTVASSRRAAAGRSEAAKRTVSDRVAGAATVAGCPHTVRLTHLDPAEVGGSFGETGRSGRWTLDADPARPLHVLLHPFFAELLGFTRSCEHCVSAEIGEQANPKAAFGRQERERVSLSHLVMVARTLDKGTTSVNTYI